MSGGPGRREVAHRLFAAEYDDASLEYAESDEERAPNFVVTPTGARVNRLFVVGVLTSVEQVNEDTVRARIADPTGAFVVYAGQYQPDELAALQSLEPPAFVAVTGKANAFTPDGSDRVLTSVRPESVAEVDADTRDSWVVTAAEHTLGRIEAAADALGRDARGDDLVALCSGEGVEPGLAEGVAKAIEHYGTTADYLGELREVALQAVEVVAGEREEADSLSLAPEDETGEYAASDLAAAAPQAAAAVTEVAGEPEAVAPQPDDAAGTLEADEAPTGTDAVDATDSDEADAATATATDAGVESSTGSTAESSTDSAAGSASESGSDSAEPASTSESGAASADATTSAADAASEPASDADTTTDTDSTAGSGSTTGTGSDLGEAPTSSVDPEPESTGDEAEPEAEPGPTGDESEPEAEPGPTGDEAEPEVDAEPDADSDGEVPDEVVDDEERERIEEEYGVGFESGTEVDDPGEADVETPDTQAEADAEASGTAASSSADAASAGTDADAADAGTADTGPSESEASDTESSTDDGAEAAETADATDGTTETADETAEASGDDEEDADAPDQADVESALLEEMDELDDGDGAEREELVATVAEETGASEGDVEDAIEDALMDGRCYEPSEGHYKPI